MRKYFMASAIAIAVFAMSAFAASLVVDGGTLQAGSDDDLTCTDQVNIDYVGFEGDLLDPSNSYEAVEGGGFSNAVMTGLGTDCDDVSVYLRIFDNDDVEIWRSTPIPAASGDSLTYSFSNGTAQGGYALYAASVNQPGSVIRSADIARVDVQIDG